jgi:hypothetical protein
MYERDFIEGTRGTQAVDWEERINVTRLREERYEKVLQRLQDSSIGSMISAMPV